MNSFTFIEKAVAYEVEPADRPAGKRGRRWCQETVGTTTRGTSPKACGAKRTPTTTGISGSRIWSPSPPRRRKSRSIRAALPELPDSRYARYTGEWGIPAADAGLLVKYRKVAEYFEEAAQGVTPRRPATSSLARFSAVWSPTRTRRPARCPFPPPICGSWWPLSTAAS